MNYVAGFALDADSSYVLLVRKNQPAWQNGRFNAIGGKIEEGETPDEAMVREFREETGLLVRDWDHLVTLRSGEHFIHFYRTRLTDDEISTRHGHTNDVGELIEMWSINDVLKTSLLIPNLVWLLPLASYRHDEYLPFTVEEARVRS